jgi:hypothetical protein
MYRELASLVVFFSSRSFYIYPMQSKLMKQKYSPNKRLR